MSVDEDIKGSRLSEEPETDIRLSEEPEPETDTRLNCLTCGKKFWTQYYLKKHVARVHEKRYKEYVREKKYPCTHEGCNKAYTTPGKLKDHETVHTGERPFECGQCVKSFGGRATFANHLKRIHLISIKDIEKIINL